MNLIQLREEPKWGPSGQQVYERTYSRTINSGWKAGQKETWWETVNRVVDGNLGLVDSKYHLPDERERLVDAIYNFRLLPGGRHLWMSGVEGRQFLFNCYVAGWGDKLADHFEFVFDQLMQGGGVGSNYSSSVMPDYTIYNLATPLFILSDKHPDYKEVKKTIEDLGLGKVLYVNGDNLPFTAQGAEIFRVPDSREGWVSALSELLSAVSEPCEREWFMDAETEVYCIPVVYDLNDIRPSGVPIKTFGGTSAGPGPLVKMLVNVNRNLTEAWVDEFNGPVAMEIDHSIAECVVSGNVRRSARMSMMHWKDMWIDWFLSCKSDGMHHWSTNISVIVDDEFFRDLNNDEPQAKRVLQLISEGMLKNGEPGIFNISLASEGERGQILATNPCGEITLEPWENCNLGHVNLDLFSPADFGSLVDHHILMTRFLIRATFGDYASEKTKEISYANRRIGLGHTGVAGYLARNGIDYCKADNHQGFRSTLRTLYASVRHNADLYADELGIPRPVKVTTIAPTGTVSKMPGVTEGIHPPYAKYFIRRIRYSTVDPDQIRATNRYHELGYRVIPDVYAANTDVVEIPTKELLVSELEGTPNEKYLRSIEDIGLWDALSFQAMYQECWADNSISYTVNVQQGWYELQDVMDALQFYGPRLKGTTLMVDESRELAPYQRITKEVFDRYKNGDIDAGYDEACASGACPVK